jgi:flavin-dependent dehydrogenase
MIDPFTGTGIQMALRTGEMAADAVLKTRAAVHQPGAAEHPGDARGDARKADAGVFDSVLERYAHQYENEFHKRMKVAGLLRTAPATARLVAGVLTRMPRLTNAVLRATRTGNGSRSPLE